MPSGFSVSFAIASSLEMTWRRSVTLSAVEGSSAEAFATIFDGAQRDTSFLCCQK